MAIVWVIVIAAGVICRTASGEKDLPTECRPVKLAVQSASPIGLDRHHGYLYFRLRLWLRR
jgi:hypothetical protein